MRNPDNHDQPAEGGEEQVERALQKQSEKQQQQRRGAEKTPAQPQKPDEK